MRNLRENRKAVGAKSVRATDWNAYARWLIILAGCAAYANSFFGVWVFDDHAFVYGNDKIRDLSRPWLLFDGIGRSRPFGFFTFALNYALDGRSTEGYHAVNLLIHLAAGITVYQVFRLLLNAPALNGRFAAAGDGLALAIALIFTVHPLQTQAVTYIYQRMESLASLFYLLTIYFYIAGREKKSALMRSLSVVSAILGMLTKEVVFTAPFTIYLLESVLFQQSFWKPIRHGAGVYAALFATMLIPFGMTYIHREYYASMGVLQSKGEMATHAEYLFSQGMVILHYLRLTFLPYGQSLDSGWDAVGFSRGIVPFVVVASSLLIGLWGLIRLRVWSIPLVVFFVILSPSSGLVVIADLMFEHRMYLAITCVICGAVLIAYWVLQGRSGSGSAKHQAVYLTAAIVMILAVVTHLRNTVYYSEVAAYSDALAKNPNSPRIIYNVGVAALARGDEAKAFALLSKLVRLKPSYLLPYAPLAFIYSSRGEYQVAMDLLEQGLSYNPSFDPCLALQSLLMQVTPKDPVVLQRESQIRNALAKSPTSPQLIMELAKTEVRLGKFASALNRLNKLIEGGHISVDVHLLVGKLYCSIGWYERGRLHITSVANAVGSSASLQALESRVTLAMLDFAEERTESAARQLEGLVKKYPEEYFVVASYARVLAEKNPTLADEYFRKAIALRPQAPDSHYNYAVFLVENERQADAVGELEKTLAILPEHVVAKQLLDKIKQKL